MLRTKVASSVIWAASLVSEQPFPERREPGVAPQQTLRYAARKQRLRCRREVGEPGSGRDVLSRTVRKGLFTHPRGRSNPRPLSPSFAAREVQPGGGMQGCGCRQSATPRRESGALRTRTQRSGGHADAEAPARTKRSFRGRARQDVAPGGSRDGFTPSPKGPFRARKRISRFHDLQTLSALV